MLSYNEFNMKVFVWIIILTVSAIGSTYSQQNQKKYADYTKSSGFMLDSLQAYDPQIVDNLEVLGRVWGYAKYHHPIFSDSLLNVDYELFELLPRVAKADKTTRNKVLLDWIEGLGDYKPNKASYDKDMSSEEHWSTLDLSWMADTLTLGSDLTSLLEDLRYAEREGNYYILSTINTPASYENEQYYNGIFRRDSGYQLLTLFRFWNIIEYFAPNKPLTDETWSDILGRYISIISITENADYLKTLMKLTGELCDGHTMMMQENYFGNRVAPIRTTWIDNSLIVLNPQEVSNLHRGDEIIRFDDKSIADKFEDVKQYVAVSNEAGLRQNTLYHLIATHKEECTITFQRDGVVDSIQVKTIPLYDADFISNANKVREESYYFLQDSVGYIDGYGLTDDNVDKIMTTFNDTKAIIIDMRCYPQYFMPVLAADYLLEKPALYIRFSYPIPTLPGEFCAKNEISLYKGVWRGESQQDNPNAYKGQIIVLVNEMTQSAAETSVMGLQAAPNTIVVGSQSAGANGTLVFIPLTGGAYTTYSSIGCYYPDGYNMQRKGVKIDIEVYPTIDGIRAGRDEVLERALECVQ